MSKYQAFTKQYHFLFVKLTHFKLRSVEKNLKYKLSFAKVYLQINVSSPWSEATYPAG